MFSFNNPQGMCPDCNGMGDKVIMSEDLMVPDPGRSILDGAVEPLGDVTSNRWRLHLYEGAARHLGFAMDAPWRDLDEEQKEKMGSMMKEMLKPEQQEEIEGMIAAMPKSEQNEEKIAAVYKEMLEPAQQEKMFQVV